MSDDNQMTTPIQQQRNYDGAPSYAEYWKTHKPTPCGLSKAGNDRWTICYSNGTFKEVSRLWEYVPSKVRIFLLFTRHKNKKRA